MIQREVTIIIEKDRRGSVEQKHSLETQLTSPEYFNQTSGSFIYSTHLTSDAAADRCLPASYLILPNVSYRKATAYHHHHHDFTMVLAKHGSAPARVMYSCSGRQSSGIARS